MAYGQKYIHQSIQCYRDQDIYKTQCEIFLINEQPFKRLPGFQYGEPVIFHMHGFLSLLLSPTCWRPVVKGTILEKGRVPVGRPGWEEVAGPACRQLCFRTAKTELCPHILCVKINRMRSMPLRVFPSLRFIPMHAQHAAAPQEPSLFLFSSAVK